MKKSELFGGISAILGVVAFIFNLVAGRQQEDEMKEVMNEAITNSFEENKRRLREELDDEESEE